MAEVSVRDRDDDDQRQPSGDGTEHTRLCNSDTEDLEHAREQPEVHVRDVEPAAGEDVPRRVAGEERQRRGGTIALVRIEPERYRVERDKPGGGRGDEQARDRDHQAAAQRERGGPPLRYPRSRVVGQRPCEQCGRQQDDKARPPEQRADQPSASVLQAVVDLDVPGDAESQCGGEPAPGRHVPPMPAFREGSPSAAAFVELRKPVAAKTAPAAT